MVGYTRSGDVTGATGLWSDMLVFTLAD